MPKISTRQKHNQEEIIYFAEGEVSFFDFFPEYEDKLLERFVCYYLMSDKVALHPAATLRWPAIQHLLFGLYKHAVKKGEILFACRKGHADFAKYCDTRIEELKSVVIDKKRPKELYYYLNPKVIPIIGLIDDIGFMLERDYEGDALFRKLIIDDLENSVGPASLKNCLFSAYGKEDSIRYVEAVKETALDNSKTFSRDIVYMQLAHLIGCRIKDIDYGFRFRMQVLFYEVNSWRYAKLSCFHRQENGIDYCLDPDLFDKLFVDNFGVSLNDISLLHPETITEYKTHEGMIKLRTVVSRLTEYLSPLYKKDYWKIANAMKSISLIEKRKRIERLVKNYWLVGSSSLAALFGTLAISTGDLLATGVTVLSAVAALETILKTPKEALRISDELEPILALRAKLKSEIKKQKKKR